MGSGTNSQIRLLGFKRLLALPHLVCSNRRTQTDDALPSLRTKVLTTALSAIRRSRRFFLRPISGDSSHGGEAHRRAQQSKYASSGFLLRVGGYETRTATRSNRHSQLLIELSQAMSAFYNATVEIGVDQSVTTFTASDFGRTFGANTAAAIMVGAAINCHGRLRAREPALRYVSHNWRLTARMIRRTGDGFRRRPSTNSPPR